MKESVETPTPWLRIREGAAYAKVGPKVLYRAIRDGKLRAARVGGRREVRTKAAWLDAFLEATSVENHVA